MPSGSLSIIARMTVRKPGRVVTVEVRADAGFHNFYIWHAGHGRGRKQTHATARSDGQRYHHRPAGLEVIATRFTNGEQVKITILKKRLYKKFLDCSGDQLPGYKPVIVSTQIDTRAAFNRRMPVGIDSIFTQPNHRNPVMDTSYTKE